MRPTPPTNHASSIRISLRQSKDETSQQSTGRQRTLADRCLAELRSRGNLPEGLPIVVYEDVNCARYDFQRPGFLQLMSEVGKGDIVIVAWRDRLGSGSRYVVAVEDIVKHRGARLFIADPVIEEITWDKTRGLLEAIHGSQSDAYVEDLRVKVIAALRDLLAEGYAAGNVPFGYTTEPDPTRRKMIGTLERLSKKILIDEEEAKLVIRMFEMRLTKPKAIGWVTIAKTLNAEGLRSPTGGLWGGGTIRQIVTNTAYIGLWSMGDRKGLKEGGRRTMVPGDDPVLIKVPGHLRIVPQELWDAVQEVTANDPQAGRMNAGRPVHALAGVIRCAECGGALSTAYGRKKHRFYSCSRRRRSGACDAKGTIPADRLEAAIIIEAAKILDLFAGALQHALHSRADVAAITKRPDVSKVAAELKAAQDRLRKARKIAYASDDESEETISHLKQLGEDVKRLELSQAAATAEVQTAADFEQETLTLLANMRSALQAEPLAARATLNAMFPRGLALAITPDTYRITGVPRIGDSTPRLDPSGSNRGVLSLNLSIPRRAA